MQAPSQVLPAAGVARLQDLAQAQLDVTVDVLAEGDEAPELAVDLGQHGQQARLDQAGVAAGIIPGRARASIRTWPMLPATSWR